MNARRLPPYLVGLVILAFALGSLSRGSTGGSLLFQSTWLLYLIYLGPVIVLSIVVALIVLIGLNWRDLGTAIGFGMASKRRVRKRRSPYSFLISMIFWALAIGILLFKKGSIFNPTPTNSTNIVTEIVGPGSTPPNPLLAGGLLPVISSIVDNSWFGVAFLGLLAVCSLVLVQSVRVAIRETRDVSKQDTLGNQIEGLEAVNDAIKLINDETADPRSRIMACYQHMIRAVSRLGAPVSSDQTARELERAIRSTFTLKGPSTSDLTQLFEEARYSLHEINNDDATNARAYLESIAEELQTQIEN